MNKEVIKKFKTEFDHWLEHGDESIIVRYAREQNFKEIGWMNFSNNANFWSDNCIYVINDEYVEFRKALTEGKTIQWESSEDNWEDLPISFTFNDESMKYGVDEYRIKPKEKIKIGDWIRYFDNIHETMYISKIETQEQLYQAEHDDNVVLWKPERHEVCWFWTERDKKNPTLGTFLEMSAKTQYYAKIGNGQYDCCTYINCAPFIGVEPPVLYRSTK